MEIFYAIDAYEKDGSAYAMIIAGANNPDSEDPRKEAYSSGGHFSAKALAGVSEGILSDIAQKREVFKQQRNDSLSEWRGLFAG